MREGPTAVVERVAGLEFLPFSCSYSYTDIQSSNVFPTCILSTQREKWDKEYSHVKDAVNWSNQCIVTDDASSREAL